LPLRSVAVTEEGGKILVDEHPSAAWLASRQDTALGAVSDFFRVHLEEGSGLGQRQGLHDHDE
jgi:hypothetical protein